jgi:dipeptidyl aminopeptidase/acylaminoacyl peptidase
MPVRPCTVLAVALCLLALGAAGSAPAQIPAPPADGHLEPGPDTGGLTLEVIMAHPDWLGRAPENAYWADDGESVYFERKREGEEISDLYEVDLQGDVHRVADEEMGTISVPEGDWSRNRTRKVYTRAGDVYLRDLSTGEVRQLTRTAADESQTMFMADESRIAFRRGDAIYVRDLDSGLEWQPAEVLAEEDPAEAERAAEEAEGYLGRQQEELFEIIRLREERERARRERHLEERRADPTRAPPPFYLGDDVTITGGSLSPSGDWMLVTTAPEKADEGKRDLMPELVTETGYVETEEVRPKVGTGDGSGQRLWLLDLRRHEMHELDLAVLPGIDQDPLAELREAAEARREREEEEEDAEEDGEEREAEETIEEGLGEQAEEAEEARQERDVLEGEETTVEEIGEPEVATVDDEEADEDDEEADDDAEPEIRAVNVGPMVWNEEGTRVAVQLFAVDNKDRWIATIDLEGSVSDPELEPFHRLHDEAWINWRYHEMDWLPGGEELWYLSEEDGFSQLYAQRPGGSARRVTRGEFVVWNVTPTPDGETFYFRGNREHPGIWEVYRVPADPADPATSIERVTHMDDSVEYVLSPHGETLLLRHSTAVRPPELYVQEVPATAAEGEETADAAAPAPREPRRLTNTVSDEYLAFGWTPPEIVAIPSSHGAHRPIFSRLYLPEDHDPSRAQGYPAVMFVHGAGYTQDVFDGWSYYFREHMFHEMLTRLGYVVLEMDYRGSAGYGRDWRTAIYRRMGTPELEDHLDGIDWLAEEQNVDPERVGIYGGSYGGFMTMMALFKEPGEFAAGAALRPVTDWAHYNHGYTSNILNTPEIDPEAYERSSPIELAEGLEDPLLIIHGMLDDNVLFLDSVRLAQRLIELEKEDWWLVPYPIEPHAFEEPSSWLDAYRRIFDLMERYVRLAE